MKKILLIVFLISITYTIVSKTVARSPAVEPVIGLSIDEYPEGDPKKKRGYNFKNQSKESQFIGKRKPAESLRQARPEQNDPTWVFLVVLMLVIPIATVLIINRKTKKLEPHQQTDLNNTIELFPETGNTDDSDDDDFKKAS